MIGLALVNFAIPVYAAVIGESTFDTFTPIFRVIAAISLRRFPISLVLVLGGVAVMVALGARDAALGPSALREARSSSPCR